MPHFNRRKRVYRRRRATKKHRGGRMYRRKHTKALRPKVMRLTKQVRKLASIQAGTTGELIYRASFYDRILSADSSMSTSFMEWMSAAQIETGLAQLRYYDIKIPTALLTVDFSVGGYQKEVRIDQVKMSIQLRANYTVPVRYQVYLCKVKIDTGQNPVTLFNSGIADSSNIDPASELMFPRDSTQLTDTWSVKKLRSGLLKPGDEVTITHREHKPFTYDPALQDIVTAEFKKRNRCFAFFVRTQGVMAHDSVSVIEQGYQNTIVDYNLKSTFRATYDAGADIKFVFAQVGADAFTNVPHVAVPTIPVQTVVTL